MDGYDWIRKEEGASNPHHHMDAYFARGEILSRVHRNYMSEEMGMRVRKKQTPRG